MRNESTAIVERDGGWYISYCPEIPGANGQGRTERECLDNLAEAVTLILEDRREEGLRGVPPDAFARCSRSDEAHSGELSVSEDW